MAIPRHIVLWVLTAALAYLAAFAALRYGYFSSQPNANPTVRAAYAKIFYPLRWLAAFGHKPAEKFQIATIRHRANKSLELDFLDMSWTTEFECAPATCAAVQQLPLGREIGLRLAWELADDDRFALRLLDARLCTPRNAACDASRQRQVAELDLVHKEMDAEQKRLRACDARMSTDMAAIGFGDATAVGGVHAAQPVEPEALDKPVLQDCMRKLDERFAELALQSCERHRCGDGVGGGCWHLTPSFVSMRAFRVCRAKLAATRPTSSR